MENKIKEIIKKEFDAEVIEVKSTTGGYSHHMYEAKIDKFPHEIIIRFSNNKKKDVNLGKEKYVIDILDKNQIPVPKIYSFNEQEDYMILEKFPGIRLDTIWDSLTQEEKIQITKEIGKFLSKIHSIHFEKFGYIEEGGKIDSDIAFKFKTTGEPLKHSPYLRGLLKGYLEDLVRLISYKHLPKEFFSDYITFICNNLEILDYKEKPVLVHNDHMTGHLFVEKKDSEYKIVGLIDFELSISSAPADDFIKLHRQGFFDDFELKEALKQGYGQINKRAVEILRIMRDVAFAQVLFESGDKEKAEKIIKESWEKIKKNLEEDI